MDTFPTDPGLNLTSRVWVWARPVPDPLDPKALVFDSSSY